MLKTRTKWKLQTKHTRRCCLPIKTFGTVNCPVTVPRASCSSLPWEPESNWKPNKKNSIFTSSYKKISRKLQIEAINSHKFHKCIILKQQAIPSSSNSMTWGSTPSLSSKALTSIEYLNTQNPRLFTDNQITKEKNETRERVHLGLTGTKSWSRQRRGDLSLSSSPIPQNWHQRTRRTSRG